MSKTETWVQERAYAQSTDEPPKHFGLLQLEGSVPVHLQRRSTYRRIHNVHLEQVWRRQK